MKADVMQLVIKPVNENYFQFLNFHCHSLFNNSDKWGKGCIQHANICSEEGKDIRHVDKGPVFRAHE
jgi:hypothetical protein